jgi:hypothetical protein
MYRHGLGDCFLLTLSAPGASAAHVLVDCGTLGSKTFDEEKITLEEVVKDVRKATGGHLNAIVATHEHKDHVSGFGEKLFGDFEVDEVWVAWTEHPEKGRALKLRKGDLLGAALQAARALGAAGRNGSAEAAGLALGIERVVSFHDVVPDDVLGAKELAKTVNEAMSFVCSLGRTGEPRFLEPGKVLAPSFAPGVRVFVLGPPTDPEKFNTLGEHGHPDLYELARAVSADVLAAARHHAAIHEKDVPADERDAAREEFERRLPFDVSHCVPATDENLPPAYVAEGWRRIDHDWLASAADLAVQLDDETNNASLVLAFEIDGGDVLLFAADAQLGNWQTWKDVKFDGEAIDAADLLARTVFYKVGHHASHNATMKPGGLEAMTRDDLVAFIPLDEEVAKNKGASGWTMPAPRLYERLLQKTHGWVLRSDTKWPKEEDLRRLGLELDANGRDGMRVVIAPAYVDLEID